MVVFLWIDKGKKYWGEENINEEEIRGANLKRLFCLE
jgi:hypothetical protein